MKTKTRILVIVLSIAGATAGWWMMNHPGAGKEARVSLAGRTSAEQALVDSVMESPEQFDASTAVRPAPEHAVKTGSEPVMPRPQLLSEVDKPQPSVTRHEPVQAEDLYFWAEYASLRNPEIRDPDSKENRQGAVLLMQAMQRRMTRAGE